MAVGPLEPYFRGQLEQKCQIGYAWRNEALESVSKTVNVFRIGWTVIESRPERDPKWTRLCDLLPTWSSWWRHFRWKCKLTIEGYAVLNFEIASFSSFRDIKIIIWWRRRTSVISITRKCIRVSSNEMISVCNSWIDQCRRSRTTGWRIKNKDVVVWWLPIDFWRMQYTAAKTVIGLSIPRRRLSTIPVLLPMQRPPPCFHIVHIIFRRNAIAFRTIGIG